MTSGPIASRGRHDANDTSRPQATFDQRCAGKIRFTRARMRIGAGRLHGSLTQRALRARAPWAHGQVLGSQSCEAFRPISAKRRREQAGARRRADEREARQRQADDAGGCVVTKLASRARIRISIQAGSRWAARSPRRSREGFGVRRGFTFGLGNRGFRGNCATWMWKGYGGKGTTVA